MVRLGAGYSLDLAWDELQVVLDRGRVSQPGGAFELQRSEVNQGFKLFILVGSMNRTLANSSRYPHHTTLLDSLDEHS